MNTEGETTVQTTERISPDRRKAIEKHTTQPDLSVIIVCFNDHDVLMPCLASLQAAKSALSVEVIVVDNASRDASVSAVRKHFPNVRVVQAGYNAGFTGGNNIGFEQATGRYVLFLNPDTLIDEYAFDVMVERADRDPEIGAVGPMVLNRDRTLQFSCFRSPTVGHFLSKAMMLHRLPGYRRLAGNESRYPESRYRREMDVDVISGCAMLVRRDLLLRIGAFDDEYFIYFEETDLCERIRRAGYRIVYLPEATIVHLGGQTTVKQQEWFRIQYERSRRRFFSKHRSRLAYGGIVTILVLDTGARWLLGGIATAVTLGQSESVRRKTALARHMLLWQLGLRHQGQRPT